MKVTNKVKIEKVYLFTENKPEPVNTINNKTDDKKANTQLTFSAESLKITLIHFFGLISSLLIVLFAANAYIIIKNESLNLNGLLMISASFILSIPYISFIVYQQLSKSEKLKKFFNISSDFAIIIVTIESATVFVLNNKLGLHILFQLLFFMFSICFFAVSKDLEQEENRDYILNYFSALTAFVALIVSLVALFK